MELEEINEVMKVKTLVSQNTSTFLVEELNDLQQYSRRSCLIPLGVGMENKWKSIDHTDNVVPELLTTEF